MIYWANIVVLIAVLAVSESTDSDCACGRAPLAKVESFKQEKIDIENHPWMVRVAAYGYGTVKERNNCDGYVISPRHILTRTECGCREDFKHTLYYGSSQFKNEYPARMPGGKKMSLASIKCLDTQNFTIIEIPDSLPLSSKLQPICVAKNSVFDKNSFKAYQISWNMFFQNWDDMYIEAITQWGVDLKDVSFQPEKDRTRLPVQEVQIDSKHVLLALSPSGQWSITGIDLSHPEWNYKNYMAHHLDVYRDLLKKSPEICLV